MKYPLPLARLLVLLLLCVPAGLQAQTIRGTVVDRESSSSVQGALVVLLDESGAQRGGTLSGERGEFLLSAPAAGRYSVRAQRVGYSDGRSPVIAVGAGEALTLRLTLQPRAIELDGVAVEARRRCTVRPQEGLLVANLWEEARKALGATAFTEQAEMYGYRMRGYRRLLDSRSLRVLQDSSRVRETFGHDQPYASLPADSLLRHGFIQMDGRDPVFYAPDAHVLLSDAFLDSYCLRPAVAAGDEELVGIAFEPVERRGPPAVRGTLWLDRESYELRALEYNYARVAAREQRDPRVGGRVEFEALPNGAWIVRRWWIRMPEVRIRSLAAQALAPHEQRTLTAIAEEGGEVLEIRAAAGRRALRSLATLEGMVYDSVRAAPMAGALVYLSGTSYADSTDGRGRFRIEQVPDGEYELSFTHPELRRLNIHPAPRRVRVQAESQLEVELGLPRNALAVAFTERCREESRSTPAGPGVLVGRVVDELTGQPLPQARVTVSWAGFQTGAVVAVESARAATQSGADGEFLVCGLPTDRPLQVQARLGNIAGAQLALEALDRGTYAERDLHVPVTRGHTVVLVLRDWESGEPIRDAVVSLPGRDLQALTDRDGRARLENVPAGAHPFEIQHVAYGSIPDELQVEPGAAELEVRVPARVLDIPGVEVIARSAVELARRRSGSAMSVMTRDQIEQRLGVAGGVAGLARRMPGIRVREIYYPGTSTIQDVCLETTRGTADALAYELARECPARILVVVNDIPTSADILLTLPPEQLESLQYLSSAEGVQRFGRQAANGVLVIYTRGLGPFRTPGR